jgi:ArsR family metal-binding transcriptional regulator
MTFLTVLPGLNVFKESESKCLTFASALAYQKMTKACITLLSPHVKTN